MPVGLSCFLQQGPSALESNLLGSPLSRWDAAGGRGEHAAPFGSCGGLYGEDIQLQEMKSAMGVPIIILNQL